MILILSSQEDASTNVVIDYLKNTFSRISTLDFIVQISISLNDAIISLTFANDKKLNDIEAYWYRRDDISLLVNAYSSFKYFDIIKQNCDNEFLSLKHFLFTFLESKKSLGSYKKEFEHNKLITLYYAGQLGLEVPKTLITNLKSDAKSFASQSSDSITKTLSNMLSYSKNGFNQSIGTQKIDNSNIEILDNCFFPTLLQNRIEKLFELRIFYMHGQFYSMAIFSQNDEQTKLDYRNYNREKPNRNIPYILPNEIKDKLQLLMNKLDLNTGSIDMIVTPKGEYVFLEVNPTGQFGWVSDNCNYYLEEKIANHLQGA
jgi:ATP-GRASP peptide maturase of grasp-with-spasm system